VTIPTAAPAVSRSSGCEEQASNLLSLLRYWWGHNHGMEKIITYFI